MTLLKNDLELDGLNKEQKEAVLHDQGPLLILAGAGSGKTRVITHRIAYLIKNRGVAPYRILALTFTNKAANEMTERIEALIGEDVRSLWVGTFHSIMARILRRHIELLDYKSNFTIIDSDDQLKLLRDCLKELQIDEDVYTPRLMSSAIGKAKNRLIGPEDFAKRLTKDFGYKNQVSRLYTLYQKKLKESNALDFDDILFFTVKLFREHQDVLDYYRGKFLYVLVDEYQDTNHAQYAMIELLAQEHGNLCVVGDDDQSIYAFRGANINNILDFEEDFKGCKTIKLERNYRSTGNILGAANKLIANNTERKEKNLWTSSEEGDLITLLHADNQTGEARYIAGEISRLVSLGGASYGDIAILYRMNALSRNLENELMAAGVPYRLYGGMRFLDRKEIKDVLAYMRLLIADDDLAFDRIVNVPRRGIGDVTKASVINAALENNISLLEAARISDEIGELAKASGRLKGFASLIEEMRETLDRNDMTLAAFFDYVHDRSGIVEDIISRKSSGPVNDAADRIENLKEHLSAIVEFENQLQENIEALLSERRVGALAADTDTDVFRDEDLKTEYTLREKLEKYLENTALYAAVTDTGSDVGAVSLMTMHSAKGLEFDYVFIVAAEERIFPGERSINEGGQAGLEEERRLAYVSITRAKKKLYITTALSRLLFGQTRMTLLSRFVKEIPREYLAEIGRRRYSADTQQVSGQAVQGRSAISTHARHSGFGLGGSSSLSRSFADKLDSRSSKAPKKKEGSPRGLSAGQIKVTDSIMHPKFGKGVVKKLIPAADDAIIEIDFEDFGYKKMLVNQSGLDKA